MSFNDFMNTLKQIKHQVINNNLEIKVNIKEFKDLYEETEQATKSLLEKIEVDEATKRLLEDMDDEISQEDDDNFDPEDFLNFVLEMNTNFVESVKKVSKAIKENEDIDLELSYKLLFLLSIFKDELAVSEQEPTVLSNELYKIVQQAYFYYKNEDMNQMEDLLILLSNLYLLVLSAYNKMKEDQKQEKEC
ncbi:MAG: mitochondrial import receptor subunit TOM22 [Ignavibacterium sp.]|nr:mitochondrial import receptor subunit TOM22 [Ignavibacterium sp.]